MKLAASLALLFGVLSFAQSAPDNNQPAFPGFRLPETLASPQTDPLKKRFEKMKLLNGPLTLPPQIIITKKSTVCAIPLLNALPANARSDYRIQVVKPPSVDAGMAPKIGIPSCAVPAAR